MDVFTHIVLTAPNSKICSTYQKQLEELTSDDSKLCKCKCFCISDPGGARIGSGGGTLNALGHLLNIFGVDQLLTYKIAIIHSGGDSRRAPLHSICGKAWATINARTYGTVASPVSLLLKELGTFCLNIQPGTVVIACSDVMLDLVDLQNVSTAPQIPRDAVTIVTVPESPDIAKNHGVVIDSNPQSKTTHISVAVKYLQKPSINLMRESKAVRTSSDGSESVLIDTGLIIFSGDALRRYLALMGDSIFMRCTDTGLASLGRPPTAEDVLRLELYSDLLLPLRTQQGICSLSEFYSRLGVAIPEDSAKLSWYHKSLPLLWTALQNVPLYNLAVESGMFAHLGTSAELLEMLNCSHDFGRRTALESGASRNSAKLLAFANKYDLQPEIKQSRSYIAAAAFEANANLIRQSVAINSIIEGAGEVCGPNSCIEHSMLLGNVAIGAGSVVSHVHGPLAINLSVPNDTMVQMIPLNTSALRHFCEKTYNGYDAAVGVEQLVVLLTLGVHDDIKIPFEAPGATVCGVTWQVVFESSGLSPTDIWSSSLKPDDRSLWTARLFPVFPAGRPPPSASWLLGLRYEQSQPVSGTLRLSLSDILSESIGDAGGMFLWRSVLQRHAVDCADSASLMRLWTNYECTCACIGDLQSKCDLGRHVSVEEAAALLILLWTASLCVGESIQACALSEVLVSWEPFTSDKSFLSAGIRSFQDTYLKSRSKGLDSFGLVQLWKDMAGTLRLKRVFKAFLAWLESHLSTTSIADSNVPRILFVCAWVSGQANETVVPAGLLDSHFDAAGADSRSECVRLIKLLRDTVEKRSEAVAAVSLQGSDGGTMQLQLEALAQRVVRHHIEHSLASRLDSLWISQTMRPSPPLSHSTVYIVKAPVRIDLSGGWSDTPPICYQALGGSVLNVAVLVDGQYPVIAASRSLPQPVLRLVTVLRSSDGSYSNDELTMDLPCTVPLPMDPGGHCTLLKACLVAVGVLSSSADTAPPFPLPVGTGLELVTRSSLPAGSGMGGSSVLSAAVLRSVLALLHRDVDNLSLVYLASHVEQLMTTGGGWQDQVGAIFGGFKIGRSIAGLPLSIAVDQIPCPPALVEAFNKRVFVIYTGTQRLAKNVLISALRAFSLSPPTTSVVSQLVAGAERCASAVAALDAADQEKAHDVVDALGAGLGDYWELKKRMAQGSEPVRVRGLFAAVGPLCVGTSLCGAGGGGYAAVVLHRQASVEDLRRIVKQHVESTEDVVDALTIDMRVQSVQLDQEGLSIEVDKDTDCSKPLEALFNSSF